MNEDKILVTGEVYRHPAPSYKEGKGMVDSATVELDPKIIERLWDKLLKRGYSTSELLTIISDFKSALNPEPEKKEITIKEINDIQFNNYHNDTWEYHIQKCYDKINEIINELKRG